MITNQLTNQATNQHLRVIEIDLTMILLLQKISSFEIVSQY
jgi:hypothetical protein